MARIQSPQTSVPLDLPSRAAANQTVLSFHNLSATGEGTAPLNSQGKTIFSGDKFLRALVLANWVHTILSHETQLVTPGQPNCCRHNNEAPSGATTG